jgi:transcriptional regulator with GAF, ATPase, and Fis domain
MRRGSRPSLVDVRLVIATDRNLLAATRENRFREGSFATWSIARSFCAKGR